MFLACSTLGKPKKLNFQLWVRLGKKFMKDPVWWCGGGVIFWGPFLALGKPKELNFQLWLKLSEKFMKDPAWWCGLWFVVFL